MNNKKSIDVKDLQKLIKTIIGDGVIKHSKTQYNYKVGDVMIHMHENKVYIFKCLVAGQYSLPDVGEKDPKFKQLNLKGR